MLLNEKIKMFNKELSMIKTLSIKRFVIECLDEAPDYIFKNCPSSSTGKYHSIDEFSPLGNVLHTKRVVNNCDIMARAFNLKEKDYDLVIGAAILHDMVKQGFEKTGHTVNDHAVLAAQLVRNVFKKTKSKINKKDCKIIENCVLFHNGIWSSGEENDKPIDKFTMHELCVHMSDYSATKFCLTKDAGGGNDIFDEFKNFVENFKVKFKIENTYDIPIMLMRFLGALCSNIGEVSKLEEKLMIIAAWCIKSVLYIRINNEQL